MSRIVVFRDKPISTVSELNFEMIELGNVSFTSNMLSKEMWRLWRQYESGMDYLDENEPDSALDVFQNLIGAHPKFAAVYAAGSIALMELEQYDEALDLLRRGRAIAPKWALMHRQAANVYDKIGDHKSELEQWERALALEPEHLDTIWNIACVYTENFRQADEAARYFRRYLAAADADRDVASDEHDRRAKGWKLLGRIAAQQQDFDEAETCFTKSLSLVEDQQVRFELDAIRQGRSIAKSIGAQFTVRSTPEAAGPQGHSASPIPAKPNSRRLGVFTRLSTWLRRIFTIGR
jgi:tetratricopeptide (TPR) repeat protein